MTITEDNHKWWTLFAMCFALFMIMLDNTIVNVALPSIQRALHTSPESLEWTINAYVVSFGALILLGGKLGDRFGRRRIFLVGLVVFTLASAACALAQTDNQLIGARIVQGFGGALLNPLSLSILVAAFPRKQLPTAIGIWAGISGLGLAVGPLLGGFLVEQYSWSAVFWVNVPVGIIAFGVTAWAVRESRDPNAHSLDVVGTVLVTLSLFLLIWGLIKTNAHSWLSAYTLSFILVGAALMVAFLIWESRHAEPMIPLGFFRITAFTTSCVVVALVGVGLFGIIYYLTLYFQNVQGFSPQEAGVRSLPMTMMILIVAPIGGRLNARVGPRALMTLGMLMASVGLFALSRLGVNSSYNEIWPFQILMGAGMALTMPAVSSTGMAAVDPHPRRNRLGRDQRLPPGRRRLWHRSAGKRRCDARGQQLDGQGGGAPNSAAGQGRRAHAAGAGRPGQADHLADRPSGGGPGCARLVPARRPRRVLRGRVPPARRCRGLVLRAAQPAPLRRARIRVRGAGTGPDRGLRGLTPCHRGGMM